MSTRRYTCSKCQSLVEERFDNGLEYYCPTCGEIYPSEKGDIIEEVYASDQRIIQKYTTRLALAAFSPVESRVRRKCNNCSAAITTLVLMGRSMKAVYACKCGNIDF